MGLPWDAQGLVRRGRPPEQTLEIPTMAETGESFRRGGSSSAGLRSSSIRPESDTVKAGPEPEWTPVARRRRFRNNTPDPAVVGAMKKLRCRIQILDPGGNTEMDLTDAETRKRTLVETTCSDDDGPAEKYWRGEDFVAKAPMDELTGS